MPGLHPHCVVSTPLWGLHPHCGASIPTVGISIPTVHSPFPLWESPSPFRGLCPHCGVSIPIVGSLSHTVCSPSPLRGLSPLWGYPSTLWGLHLHCGVFIPFMGSPPPIPGTPYLSPGFPMPGASSVTHVDSWARCGAAQEGFLFTYLPQRLPSAFRTLIGDWSLPLWSLPRVQLCPARPGLVAL